MQRLRIVPASHEDLFLDRYERLLSWALPLTGGEQPLAEDLVHDAFLHFSLQKPNLQTIENLDAYLYRVLRNLRISQVRRSAAVRRSTLRLSDYDSAQLGLHATPPGERMRVEAELRAICDFACERKRTSKAASALILRFFHGYYPSEIMKVARAPGQAVDKLLWIARREVRDHVEQSRAVGETSPSADIIGELRQRIFAACGPGCLTRREWRELYRDSGGTPLDAPLLSHLVSCRECLATVNRLLGLKPLEDRDPPEMLGPGERSQRVRRESERRTTETVEHRPKELRILVNGLEQFSQEISSPVTHFHLAMNGEERLGFVEVITEQGIRLLFLALDPPPDGPVDQRATACFHHQSRLDVSVQFQAARPMMELRYTAPEFEAAAPRPPVMPHDPDRRSHFWRLLVWFRQPVALGVAVLVPFLALLLHWLQQPPVSAAAILNRAIAAEARADATPGVTHHRLIRLDARQGRDPKPVASGRVEVWRNPLRRVRVVRLSDERQRLVAAVWTSSTGVETRLHPPETRTSWLAAVPSAVWQTELSAAEFAAEARDHSNSLTARADAAGVRLVAGSGAELRLTADGLHATQRITTDGSYSYKLTEEQSEILPEASTPDGVFDPPHAPTMATASRAEVADTPDLEIDVLSRLNAADALTGEDVSVTTGARGVMVRAVVETQQRKRELLDALHSLAGDHLQLQIHTVDEAVREQASTQPPARVVMRDIEVPSGEVPAYPELRRFFDAEQARRFADDMLRHSLQSRLHARAFQILSAHGKPDPRLRAMLQQHATAIATEAATIRRHLEPIFPPLPTTEQEPQDLYFVVVRLDERMRSMFSLPSGPQPGRFDITELWRLLAAVERAASAQ